MKVNHEPSSYIGLEITVKKLPSGGFNGSFYEVFVQDDKAPVDRFQVVTGKAWTCDTFSQRIKNARGELIEHLNLTKAFT